ncbi:MAG: hypothetical protein KF847_04355 [Pirellulales bacterium]|nr:hypothetical protein [Pirellulales bacterium]
MTMPNSENPARWPWALGSRVLAVAGAATIVGWGGYRLQDDWFREAQAYRFAQRAYRSPTGAARPAVDALADLGASGVQRLAWLATEPRHDLAQAARNALNDRLATWLAEWRDSGNAEPLVEQLAPAVDVLRSRANALPTEDCRWCESFVLIALEATVAMPPRDAAGLIGKCDAVLTALPRRSARPRSADPASVGALNQFAAPAVDPSAVESGSDLRARSQTSPPGLSPVTTLEHAPRGGNDVPEATTAADGWASRITTAPTPSRPDREPRSASDRDAAARPVPRAPTAASGPQATASSSRLTPVPSPTDMRQLLRTLPTTATATLVARLPQADSYESAAIRRELAARGVDAAAADAVLDDNSPASSLADRLSTLPTAEARSLLRELAERGAPEQRLEALTLLATMRDVQLGDIARRRVAADEDPRVADRAAAILDQLRR